VLRAIMDISARAFSLADRPRMGHVGHRGSHAPGRPILHLVSSSRRPRQARLLGCLSNTYDNSAALGLPTCSRDYNSAPSCYKAHRTVAACNLIALIVLTFTETVS